MLRKRLQSVLLLVSLVFTVASATTEIAGDVPPPCRDSSQTADDAAPCIPPVEWQPTDGDEPTLPSLDEGEDDAIDTTSLDGT